MANYVCVPTCSYVCTYTYAYICFIWKYMYVMKFHALLYVSLNLLKMYQYCVRKRISQLQNAT